MEHRWGERVRVDLPVRVTAHPFSVRQGRLANLSVSGAFIRADFELRLLTRIQVIIESPRLKHDAPIISAYIARKTKDGIGIEWCEFAPVAVSELLQSFATRRHVLTRRPDTPATIAVTRLSAPLLKHGI